MTYYNLEFQYGKRIKVEDHNDDAANHILNQEPTVVCHDFWNGGPDDLLVEIFIRHPDCRSAVRTSTVCRRWHYLISRNTQFIQRFKSHHHQHQDRYPTVSPWAIMFRNTDIYEDHIPKPQHFRSICHLYSEEWLFLHGKLPVNCLDFLPSPMLIKASCNDLLFVSNGSRYTDDHYICNPITKQFIQLPLNPRLENPRIYRPGAIGYALVLMTTPRGATTNNQFKVVEVLPPYDYPLPLEPRYRRVQVSVFCSESRKWEIRYFPCPRSNTLWSDNCYSNIITCNEILFWLGATIESESVVYLDLSKDKCGAINIPSRNKILLNRIGIVLVSGGVHEIRLVQVVPLPTEDLENVHLRVWRLNYNNNHNDDDDDSNWFLVHDKKLEWPKNLSRALKFVGPFVHPTNGDLVFLVLGTNVIQYNLIDGTYKKIAMLLENVEWPDFIPFMVLCYGASNLATDF